MSVALIDKAKKDVRVNSLSFFIVLTKFENNFFLCKNDVKRRTNGMTTWIFSGYVFHEIFF